MEVGKGGGAVFEIGIPGGYQESSSLTLRWLTQIEKCMNEWEQFWEVFFSEISFEKLSLQLYIFWKEISWTIKNF